MRNRLLVRPLSCYSRQVGRAVGSKIIKIYDWPDGFCEEFAGWGRLSGETRQGLENSVYFKSVGVNLL